MRNIHNLGLTIPTCITKYSLFERLPGAFQICEPVLPRILNSSSGSSCLNLMPRIVCNLCVCVSDWAVRESSLIGLGLGLGLGVGSLDARMFGLGAAMGVGVGLGDLVGTMMGALAGTANFGGLIGDVIIGVLCSRDVFWFGARIRCSGMVFIAGAKVLMWRREQTTHIAWREIAGLGSNTAHSRILVFLLPGGIEQRMTSSLVYLLARDWSFQGRAS